MKNLETQARRPRRTQRRDGLSTRNAILEAAVKVFAIRGYAEATNKEICELASANSAAVNYYFGGKESLYEEVLIEAHRQMVSMELLDKIVDSNEPPENKLRALFQHTLHIAATASSSWGVKLFLRELAAPSPFLTKSMAKTALPKMNKFRIVVQEITGLPPDSAQLQRATNLVALPGLSMIMLPETLRSITLPATTTNPEILLEDMLTYALAGLRALGAVSN